MKNKEITLGIIKPDAVKAGHTGAIIHEILNADFDLTAMKLCCLSAADAGRFYAAHKERAFFNELTAFMSSGPIVALVVAKENAVESFRTLIGATDPKKAAIGTIRAKFGSSIDANAVHGSDSNSNAAIESAFFFSQLEHVK